MDFMAFIARMAFMERMAFIAFMDFIERMDFFIATAMGETTYPRELASEVVCTGEAHTTIEQWC